MGIPIMDIWWYCDDQKALKHLLISHKCRLYASVNWVSIGSGNGLLPVRHQAII